MALSGYLTILYCYAEKDRGLCQALDAHLSALKRLGHIVALNDQELRGDTEPNAELRELIGNETQRNPQRYLGNDAMQWNHPGLSEHQLEHLYDRTSIFMLLISSDFIASDHCYNIMKEALERRLKGSALVIPVILRSTDWLNTPISNLQVLPTNGKAVTEWTNRDEAFLDVTRGINKIVARLLSVTQTFNSTTRIFRATTSNELTSGDSARVLEFCEQGMALDPSNVLFYRIKCRILLERKDKKALLRFCRHASILFPDESLFSDIKNYM